MRYKLSRALGIKEPSDGFTAEEKELETLIANHTMQSIYTTLPTTRMKFIVAAHFELGYPQKLIADVLGIKQPTLVEELNLIRMVLMGYKYTPKKFKDQVKPEDLLSFLLIASGVNRAGPILPEL